MNEGIGKVAKTQLDELVDVAVSNLMNGFTVQERVEFVNRVICDIRDQLEGIRNNQHSDYQNAEDNLQGFIKAVGDPFGNKELKCETKC
jgi:hypothetical protein